MENFPSNSREQRDPPKEQPEKKVVLRVVEGDVVRRKKPLSGRVKDMFFGDDTTGVLEHVVMDVLIPALKDMVSDAFHEGVDRRIYGDSRPAGRRSSNRSRAFNGGSNPTNYNRFSSNSTRREEPRTSSMSRRARATHDFDEIIIQSRREADDVIEQLTMILDTYEVVSVKDLYELVGVESHYTDEKWGWTDLRGARVTRISNGYLLDLPKTEQID